MNGFHRVSLSPRVFKREFNESVKTEAKVAFTRTAINASGITPVKSYFVNGAEYVYCSDNALRVKDGNGFTATNFTSSVIPLVLPVIENGEKTVMFVNNQTAKIGTETVSGVPFGKSGDLFCGRLFIADGNKLKYSEEFDFTDFSVGLNVGGFVETDSEAGDILFIFNDGKKLYAVCKRAVFAIETFGKPYEFKMEKIVSGLDVLENSAVYVGDEAGFISGKYFYTFNGKKLTRKSGVLLDFASFTAGVAFARDGLYVFPFTSGGNSYIYAYDFTAGTEVLQKTSGYTVSGGYAKKANDDMLYKIELSVESSAALEEYSGEYDFGTCAKKAVTRVEAHIDGSCRVTVTGEGKYTALMTEKCNSLPCFVHGKNFNITFSDASENFKLRKLAVYYVIYGE